MTAADGYAREVAEFLDVWDAAPAHRTGYRDVISSQKTGGDGRKLRATTLRGLLAEFDGYVKSAQHRRRWTREITTVLTDLTTPAVPAD